MNLKQKAIEYYNCNEVEVEFCTFYNKISHWKSFYEASKKESNKWSTLNPSIVAYREFVRYHLDYKTRNSIVMELKPIYNEWKQGLISLAEYEVKLRDLHIRRKICAL